MRLALHPSLDVLPAEKRAELQAAIRSRWAKVVMISIALILISGFINYVLVAKGFDFRATARYYHPLMGIKVLLALPIFFIASRLHGRSQAAERFRQRAGFWMTVNIVLAVIVVCLAGIARFAPRVERLPREGEAAQVAPLDPDRSFPGRSF